MPADLEILREIDVKLNALLAVMVDQHLRSSPALASPRPRSIDRVLADAGLSTRQVATLLGKSRQAVEQMLDKDAKPKLARDASEAIR